jgi:predicted ATPase
MRVAISGSGNTGKTTLINNIRMIWKDYISPERTYRDLIVEKEWTHSSNTTPEAQRGILNFMVDNQLSGDNNLKVLYDRCPLDNLAYTLWAHSKGIEGFTKEFVDESISIVKESMRSLDIIFLLRYDPEIKIVDDGMRDIDVDYIMEIDNIFHAFYEQFTQNPEADIFFPKHDTPVIIPLPTSAKDRIESIKDYLDESGELYGEDQSMFNPENLDEMERFLKQQQNALDAENAEKELYEKFGLSPKDKADAAKEAGKIIVDDLNI